MNHAFVDLEKNTKNVVELYKNINDDTTTILIATIM